MLLTDMRGKTVCILGFGKEGQSTLSFLTNTIDASFVIADRRCLEEFSLEEQQLLSSHSHFLWDNWLSVLEHCDVIVRSPGISPYEEPLSAYKDIITSQTDLFFSHYTGPVIAVTWTKGKSTTAQLTFLVLKEAWLNVVLWGNVWTPLLSTACLDGSYDFVVCELSSFQLCDVVIDPTIAVITNLGIDHIDYHHSVAEYHRAKRHIVWPHTTAFLHHSIFDVPVQAFPVLSYASPGKWVWYDEDFFYHGEKKLFPTDCLSLLGHHNKDNACAVISVALQCGVAVDTIARVFSHFRWLPHRLEFVAEKSDIRFYNDSQATSPGPSLAALAALWPEIGSIMLWGSDSGFDYTKLVKILKSYAIPVIILFPDTVSVFREMFVAIDYHPTVYTAWSMQEAVALAFAHTPKHTVCLLSPAAKSFSLFRNVYDRGDQFRACVLAHAS